MIKVANCTCSLDEALQIDFHAPNTGGPLLQSAAAALGISAKGVASAQVLRRSVDARKKNNVHFVLMLAVALKDPAEETRLVEAEKAGWYSEYRALRIPKPAGQLPEDQRPVVVGLGPAGLFAALYLARAGLRPVVFERGADVENRQRQLRAFNAGGPLDTESNVQFGEGGAGTFSDGKLTTGIKHPMAPHVLQLFLEAGAPVDILIDAKPHIGSDNLPGIVRHLRNEIIDSGGSVHFNHCLRALSFEKGRLSALSYTDEKGEMHTRAASNLILACGHSARDTFQMLFDSGLRMEQKPFSMGVRIEHLQSRIDESQYGAAAGHAALPPSEYKMAVHLDEQRSAYTFCMCPGGEVLCAASEEGGVVTNGMSNCARNGRNANAALLVNVDPADFGGSHPLAGIELQRQVERAAYRAGCAEGEYRAPAQTVGDFLAGESGHASKSVQPSYARGVVWTDLHRVLPAFVASSLEAALPAFERKLHGFASPEAVLSAPETRSSSPVRLCRNAALQASFAAAEDEVPTGIYPCGEGPGFAGGIMSAACDGLRVGRQLACSLQFEQRFACCLAALRAGRPAVFPTDTVYGLGVAVAFAESPAQLFELKGRSQGKPVAWLVSGVAALDEYGASVPEAARRLARRFWPGPLTIIVKASGKVGTAFAGKQGSIGLRMPESDCALRLIREAGCPLATTSANLSGQPAPGDFEDVCEELGRAMNGAFLCTAGKASGLASTVVDCSQGTCKLLREGTITAAEVQACLES